MSDHQATLKSDPSTSFRGDTGKQIDNGGGGSALISVQPLRRSEMQPSYAQDLGLADIEHGFYGSMMNGLGSFIGCFGQIPCCICFPSPFKQVQQGSVGLVSRFGKFYKSVDPGIAFVNVVSESLKIVDVKVQVTPVPQQTVMTKDSVNILADSIIVWHVNNPYRAAYGIADVRNALVETAQTTLRDVIGSRSLQAVIADREGTAVQVERIVERVADKWGIKVESILLKDILFSKELQESLSSAATSRRVGEAKIIAAKAEVEAAVLFRKAADVLSSPAALQIRQLDAYQAMAKTANSKVIFVPTNFSSDPSLMTAQTSASATEALKQDLPGSSGPDLDTVVRAQQLASM